MVWGFVFTYVSQESIAIDFFGIPLPSLHIATWSIVPLVLLYVASVLHILFYSILGNFKLRKYEKDYENLLNATSDAYLGLENRHNIFKTPRYQLLGNLIDNSNISIMKNIEANSENEKLDTVINIIKDIKDNKVVDLKKFSLLPHNKLSIMNNLNKYIQGVLSNEDILENQQKYEKTLIEKAYFNYVSTASLQNIEKYKEFLAKESLLVILSRINASENILKMSNEQLISLIDNLELHEKDYIDISKALSTNMLPEQRIKLFETLMDLKDEVTSAYLYTLFDLEMLDPANAILDNSQNDEYLKFKAYRDLKALNKNYNINLFV
jgi:hypothetical protein